MPSGTIIEDLRAGFYSQLRFEINFVKNGHSTGHHQTNSPENGNLFGLEEDVHRDKSYFGVPPNSLLGEGIGEAKNSLNTSTATKKKNRIPDPLIVAPAVGCISCYT